MPWHTPFPMWSQSVVPCPVLAIASCCKQISQEAGQVVWYSHLFKNFQQFVVIHTIKGCGIVNKAGIDVFLELLCFFSDPMDVDSLISGSSAFSKSSLNIWKFLVHVLLKPGLENFECYFANMWMSKMLRWFEHSLVLPFFGIRMKTDLSSPVATAEFPNLLAYWVHHFHSIIF